MNYSINLVRQSPVEDVDELLHKFSASPVATWTALGHEPPTSRPGCNRDLYIIFQLQFKQSN
jgi:hypothetical protein